MANHGDMSPEDFERLLQWLGPDRDQSSKRYVELQAHLTRWFYFQGCRRPEDLTDQVWDRIAKKLPSAVTPNKDTVCLLLGYARNVLREYWSEMSRFDEESDPDEGGARNNDSVLAEVRTLCLDLCLKGLDDDDGQLLREYHKYEPGHKSEHRKAMAEARRSTLNAIRLKVSRLMSDLGNS